MHPTPYILNRSTLNPRTLNPRPPIPKYPGDASVEPATGGLEQEILDFADIGLGLGLRIQDGMRVKGLGFRAAGLRKLRVDLQALRD